MTGKQPIFDTTKAREILEKGKRSKWWKRVGAKSRGFKYVDANGKAITDAEHLERIKLLVVPPAWRHVRIAPSAGSRVQVVGMDTTGRIQYRYHTKYSEKQQKKKFTKIESFGKYLPQLRKVTNEHIALDGFPREKVLAVMMRLINSLYMRVGTDKSARHYKTFGITTLQNRHLEFGRKGELVFNFVGKSHIKHRKIMVDQELASLMKDLKELGPKRKLFHYLDEEGKPRAIKPGDLNDYLKTATAPEFSSKDFRTWGGTLLAAIELAEIGKPEDENQLKKNICKAVKKVAEQLGNTPTVCRASYVHPTILKKYEAGITLDEFRTRKARRITRIETDYEPEEKALLKLFDQN
ncbi:MAG: DNA topoisomerase IB [Blastocatellia bacterium]|nr:DNA topoisomerase IB [Blastocatellia bacterium]MDQ3220680.1 DNA topoisomerase IB [Acidobacteriota bacterium]